ncbi:hypothetical protein EKG37_11940 [Robertmurraya yapensis]|uniref:ABM domain-containing protein n=2 Tax=Bacillaceae TaxID=186817 RepID=A0A3S0KI32_9BACI|nr:hypothetical protein [Bacillus yapensis]RTR31009.1 hypothetical protein EKG37_11940 [Bacillus yapensis]TKS95438.1 hypothetical protein FAR12_11940 [Bacillus yapensis]
MSIFVYQTFEVKQEKFKEAIECAKKIKKYRNEEYNHHIEILTPITGQDYTYAFLVTYEGLAEMELQNKKMFDDEKYIKLIGEFFLENIVQGSMNSQIFRAMNDKIEDKEKKE